MPNHVQTELVDRYLARARFFWQSVRDARFGKWQKMARSAAWANLVWDWEKLGISDSGRSAAERLGFVPSEVFAHPQVLERHPELLDYYRLLACLPNKGVAQLKSATGTPADENACLLLNRFLSNLLTLTARASRESLLNTVFAEAGTEWQGTWVNAIGLRASRALEGILSQFAEQQNLLDSTATANLTKSRNGFALKSGNVVLFGSEPDIECRSPGGELMCVVEIKGSADKAGAQTRLGETKKSFTKAKLENPRCVTIFLPSVLTPAVQKQLRSERDIDKVFNLLDVLRDEAKRREFLLEFYKYILREPVA